MPHMNFFPALEMSKIKSRKYDKYKKAMLQRPWDSLCKIRELYFYTSGTGEEFSTL